MTGNLGSRLRQQRESQHIALSDIAAATKIQASFFEGLERDDISRWPAGIFRRAFVRAYADAIGLDPEAICREFVERFPEPVLPIAPPRLTPPMNLSPWASEALVRSVGEESSSLALRLTLADTPLTRAAAALSTSVTRGLAVACDATVPLTIALAAFIVFGHFWMPLALAALGYCLGSLFFVGTTPGLWLLTPRWQPVLEETRAESASDQDIVYQPVDMNSVYQPVDMNSVYQPVDMSSTRVGA